ncbi:MAG TPA: hypothetical protein VLA46_07875, partial [Saprospiraceae bacterium]|nr:hypothetical protein [Saprospiraceae bacterium]
MFKNFSKTGLTCMLVFLPMIVSAQYVIKALPRWLVSTHLDYMIPREPIDQFLDEDDWGYRFEFQYRLQYNEPFLAGVYFAEAGLSKYELTYTLYDPDGVTFVKEKANTRRLDFGLTAGFYPEINWLLQPYLQGRVGMAVYQSSSILKDDETDESIDRISEMTSTVLSYGLDLGIHIVPNIWYVRGDIRVGFVANPSVSFLSLDEANAGTSDYPIDYFEEHTSAGSWLKVSV